MTSPYAPPPVPIIGSSEDLRKLADILPHLCWIADAAGNRSWFNQRWLAYTGLSALAASGTGWHAAIEPADLPAFVANWAESAPAASEIETAVRIRGTDGVYRPFLTRAIPFKDDAGHDCWLGTDTDIRRAEEARTHALAEAQEARATAELLNSMSRALTSELDTEKLTQKITDFATELTGAEFGALSHSRIDEQGAAQTLYTVSGTPRAVFAGFADAAAFAIALKRAGVVRSDDVAQDPRYGSDALPHAMLAGDPPLRSYLAAPVISRTGQVLGGLFFGHSKTGVFHEEDERIVLGIASQAAIALDNAQLFVDMRAAQRALEESNVGLRNANADLEQFAYSASHDLQEPMRNVAIYGELLASNYAAAFDDQGRQFLGHIISGTRRLERLVHDLLEYVRAASGEEKSEIGSIQASEALAKAISNLEGAILKSGAAVGADPLPRVRMRAIHLEQIFQNLIGNAIKYQAEAAPQIHVSAEKQEQAWMFTVADNGIGIDPGYAEVIFGIFKRLHGGDKYPGTGIGLAICRRIVERYHGRIWVESEVGKGSKFRFTVPA